MKRVALLSVAFLSVLLLSATMLAFSSSDADATAEVVCFDKVFQRKTGQPRHEQNVFPGTTGLATVKIHNGDGGNWLDRATVANVIINGSIIFRAKDFNKRIKYLEANVDLRDGSNVVDVTVLGLPWVRIRVEIVQRVEADGATVIGPMGGHLVIADPANALYGTKVEIPPGAVREDKVISVKKSNLSSTLPEGTTDAGPFVSFKPGGTQFALPVYVTIPYEDKDNDGFIDFSDVPEIEIRVGHHSDGGTTWDDLPIYNQDTVNNTVTIAVTHFSDLVTKVFSACTDPVFVFVIDGLKTCQLWGGFGCDNFEPSYLRKAILDMGLLKKKSCTFAYSGSDNFTLRWDGNAYNTENIIEDLNNTLRSCFHKAKNDSKKFALVTHSWGTVLGMLALKYDEDVNPDLFITLSSPAFTLNAGDGLYEHLVNDFTAEQIQDTRERLGEPARLINDFPFRWGNFWAHGDLISGPKNPAAVDSMDTGRVDHGLNTGRNLDSTRAWHAITTINRDCMKGVVKDELGRELTQDEKDRADELISVVRKEIAGLFPPPNATDYTYTTILPPGWINSWAVSVNDNGQVVGYGADDSGYGRAFLMDGNGVYETLIPPTPISWYWVHSINNAGHIVGYGGDSVQDFSLLYSNGIYTPLLPPGSSWSEARSINDSGQVLVGGLDETGERIGFLYNPNGMFTTLIPPGWQESWPASINDSGQVVGGGRSSYMGMGFLYNGGTYTTIHPPGWVSSDAWAINNSGEIVGNGTDSAWQGRGFLYNGGTYTTIHPPGWQESGALSINRAGQVVGTARDTSGRVTSFLYNGGTYTTIHPPGWQESGALSINSAGQVVGTGTDAGGRVLGFLATPVVP